MTYPTSGLTGLANLGNTCFMNSAIQCLSNTPQIHTICKKATIRNKKEGNLMKEWKDLLDIMWSKNCVVAPKRFLYGIHMMAKQKNKDIFTGYAQNDLPEFILFLVDVLHDAIKRPVHMNITGIQENNQDKLAVDSYNMMKKMYEKEYSEILSTFYGIHVSQIFDMNDNKIQHNPEPFFTIPLPIPRGKKQVTLKECFDLYTSTEILQGDNQWYNSKTKTKQDVKKNIVFFNLPDILIIDLKRFDNFIRKTNTLVDFPVDTLDLSEYVIGYDKQAYVYELYGICNHMGTVMGGHYTAFVKHKENLTWYHYNDTKVTPVEDTDTMKTPQAYCLFYKKKNKSSI